MAAEMERDLIRERTLDGLRVAQVQGRRVAARPPSTTTSWPSPGPAASAASRGPQSPGTWGSAAPRCTGR